MTLSKGSWKLDTFDFYNYIKGERTYLGQPKIKGPSLIKSESLKFGYSALYLDLSLIPCVETE